MNATTITAVKANYDRKTKGYKVEVVRDVHSLGALCRAGYMVYDDAARTLADVREGRMVPHWKPAARAAVEAFLAAEVAG